jgi:hypothetical protein
MNNRNKKAQVTLFIIIALLIIIVLIILLWPRIKPVFSPSVFSPEVYFSSCVEEDFENAIERVSSQGGSINPELYLNYKGNNIEYLCYTSEFYQTCVMQKPLIKSHIERELSEELSSKVSECFDKTRQESIQRGFKIESQIDSPKVEISRNNIDLNIPVNFVLEKDEQKTLYESFNVNKKSGLYVLIIHTLTILSWETRYGDFDTVTNMMYYPDVKIEKYQEGEGDKIYVLTDIETDEQFVFATRSLAFPAGYGIEV